MKKNYSKPNMKMVQLLSAEQLMAASKMNFNDNTTATSEDVLSNKESTDLWGGKESIWD